MVTLAYRHPDEGRDDQRIQIKEFLEEVLRVAVPITTVEIEQCENAILHAAGSDNDQLFFRLCLIWFEEFTSPYWKQKKPVQRLSERAVSPWTSCDASDKTISDKKGPRETLRRQI
jgi:hypothetical protein